MTVREIIDRIYLKQGLSNFDESNSCDKIILGSMETEVKKIATTFMATVDVINRAILQGVNFIITHEPTWFTANDQTHWLENDPVYIDKHF